MRVKSLQLLCFKLANHEAKVHFMLEEYANPQGKLGDVMIPIESLDKIMTDFCMINGLVFMLYDQYMKGEVIKKNDPRAI